VLRIAKKQADKTARKANIITYGGIVAAATILLGIYPIITDSVSLSKDVSKTISEFRKEYSDHLANENLTRLNVEALDAEIADLEVGKRNREGISDLQIQIDNFAKQISALQNELNRYIASQTK
jgi:hypothetical protein